MIRVVHPGSGFFTHPGFRNTEKKAQSMRRFGMGLCSKGSTREETGGSYLQYLFCFLLPAQAH
jgi:hypothetical protein